MKKLKSLPKSLLFILVAAYFNPLSAQVGFNNPNPHSSSIVDLTANDKGLLVPRMTSSQRLAITNPANGLLVFDITLKAFCVYDTVSNPDKWLMVNTMKADATPGGNLTTETTRNVGIGVPNPQKKLEVAGSIRSTDTIMANTAIVNQRIITGTIRATDTVLADAAIFTDRVTTRSISVTDTIMANTAVFNGRVTSGSISVTDTIMANTAVFTGTVIASEFTGNGSVPAGAIIMWYGATPPAGWKICDGTNGTPDLRGRFVVGSGTNGNPAPGDINPTYTVGTAGGENKHVLSKSELPKHNHSVTTSPTDNGQVTVDPTLTNFAFFNQGIGPSLIPDDGDVKDNAYTSASQIHSHPISGNTGDGTTDGLNGQSHENRPPYYVLTYIMKQ